MCILLVNFYHWTILRLVDTYSLFSIRTCSFYNGLADNTDFIFGWIVQSVLGLFRKFSLWLLIETNACCLYSFWILSSIFTSVVIALVSWLIVCFFPSRDPQSLSLLKTKKKQKLFKKAKFGFVESLSLGWINLNQFIDFSLSQGHIVWAFLALHFAHKLNIVCTLYLIWNLQWKVIFLELHFLWIIF